MLLQLAGPAAWNSLPHSIKLITDTSRFKQLLKLIYFILLFWHFVSAPGQFVSRALQVRICICICMFTVYPTDCADVYILKNCVLFGTKFVSRRHYENVLYWAVRKPRTSANTFAEVFVVSVGGKIDAEWEDIVTGRSAWRISRQSVESGSGMWRKEQRNRQTQTGNGRTQSGKQSKQHVPSYVSAVKK